MDNWSLTERDICTKFITPALRAAGWDEISQLREEVTFTAGRFRSLLRPEGLQRRAGGRCPEGGCRRSLEG